MSAQRNGPRRPCGNRRVASPSSATFKFRTSSFPALRSFVHRLRPEMSFFRCSPCRESRGSQSVPTSPVVGRVSTKAKESILRENRRLRNVVIGWFPADVARVSDQPELRACSTSTGFRSRGPEKSGSVCQRHRAFFGFGFRGWKVPQETVRGGSASHSKYVADSAGFARSGLHGPKRTWLGSAVQRIVG